MNTNPPNPVVAINRRLAYERSITYQSTQIAPDRQSLDDLAEHGRAFAILDKHGRSAAIDAYGQVHGVDSLDDISYPVLALTRSEAIAAYAVMDADGGLTPCESSNEASIMAAGMEGAHVMTSTDGQTWR